MNSKVRSSDPGSQENKHSIQSSQSRKQLARSDSLGQGQYKIVIGSPGINNQYDHKNSNNHEYQRTIFQENSAINIDQMTENSQYNIIEGQSVYIQSYGNSRAQSYKSNTKQVIVQKDQQQKKNIIQPQYQRNKQINCSRMLEESNVIDQFNFQQHNNGSDDSHFQEAYIPIQVPIKTVAKTNNSDTQNFMKLLGEAMTQNMTKNYKTNNVSKARQNQYLDPRTHAKSPENPLLKAQKQKLIQTKQATKNKPQINKKSEKIQEQRKNSSQRQKKTKKIELNHPALLFNNQNHSQRQQYYTQQNPINNYNQNYYRTPISPIYPNIQCNQNYFHHPSSQIGMINQLQEVRMDKLYQLQRENSKLLNQLNQKQVFIQNLMNENNFLKNKEKQLKSLIFDMQQSYKLKQASYQDQIYELNRRSQIIESQLIKRIQDNLTKQRETRLIQLLKKQRVINNLYEQRQLLQQNTINDSNFNNSIQIINNLPTQRYFSRNNKINQFRHHFVKQQNQSQDYDTKTVQNKETGCKRQKVSYMNLNQQSQSPFQQVNFQSIIRRVKSQQKPFNIQYRHLKDIKIKKPTQKQQLQKILSQKR